MTIEPGCVYEAKTAALVRVMEITPYDWIVYRKCDAYGNFLPKTRAAETRKPDFERRFPIEHGHI